MNTRDFLERLVNYPGVSGYEEVISNEICRSFKQYCKQVKIDRFFNVCAIKTDQVREGMPKVMLAAHMDEIGLMVRDIDEDGFVRFTNIGGVDQRILLAQEVIIRGTKDIYGVIGSKPPHLQEQKEFQKAVPMKDMAIDTGFDADTLKKMVAVGDLITFKSPLLSLKGPYVCGKSLDDRAGVAILFETMKELERVHYAAEVYFVATVQEEVGTRGAVISTYGVKPDIGIAIDVTHGETPDASKEETFSMDKGPVIALGPNMHPELVRRLIKVAKENGIEYQLDVQAGPTGTDARAIQVSGSGVPTLLLELPLRYMHTTVEIININHIGKIARLLALFIASLEEGWREWLHY